MVDAAQVIEGFPPTVGATLDWRTDKHPDREAFRYRDAQENWVSLSWAQTRERVHRLAAGLLASGLEPEGRVGIASSTRIEWILADLATNCAGGAVTTVYPNTQPEDVRYILSHSESTIIFAENAEQVAKITQFDDLVGQTKAIIVLDGDVDHELAISFDELEQRGAAYLDENPDCVKDAIAATTSDTLATLIYTSGTTGRPKGVELTHGAWVYEGAAVVALDILRIDDLQYLWLPLSHVFGKCLIAIQLSVGFSTAVDGRIDKIVAGLGEVKPTFMCGAPRIFEKVRTAVMAASSYGVKSKIARWAFAVGKKSSPYRLAGKPMPKALAAQYALASKLVFSKLQARLGGNIRFLISGSAKLSPQVQAWFYAADLLICEGYGLTETSAVAFVNSPGDPHLGTVGLPAPGTEVKLGEDGEVLLRGPGVLKRYHKEPGLTAEAFTDGWFHTGDIGILDEGGYLTITDRKKDLLKTSGGKYVAPQKVEGAIIANIPYVSQAVAVGDGRNYVSALITMDEPALLRWASNHGKESLSYAELTQLPEIHASIEKLMERANSKLERWETVKRFAILDHEFTVDDGGVTPNMKLRRSAISKKYADVVDGLYDAEEE